MVEVEVLNPLGVGVNVDGVIMERGGGGGTTDYDDLQNKPSINGVELVGNKTTSDLGIEIPTKVSELQNDSGYLTAETDPTVPSWAKEANPPSYELTYDPLSSTGLAMTGEAVTAEPNYTPSGTVNASLNWEYKNNKLYIYGVNTTFIGNGVRFAVEQEQS